MIRHFELKQAIRTSKVNYVLIGLLLTVSIVSHLVANRLVLIFDYPIIPSTFTYMAVFSLSDMLASFNSRRFVVLVLLGEAAANLIWLAVVTSVNVAPEPEFFHLGQAYLDVFGSVPKLYAANLCGGLIIGILDMFLFSHCYRVKKLSFFKASLLSTIISISTYTYFTDYFAFKDSYPDHVMMLAHVNTVTNILSVFCYSIVSALVMKKILNYIKSTDEGACYDPV